VSILLIGAKAKGDFMIKYGKFGRPIMGILGTLAWLAESGISDTKSHYKNIAELKRMGDRTQEERLRVGGIVAAESIVRKGKNVEFVLMQDQLRLPVTYGGTEPLPDTFRDSAEALADGKLDTEGAFHATKIQARCASKYEAKPVKPAAAPGARPAL
jgi:cytochrome c-type biogenesis protein CcmE